MAAGNLSPRQKMINMMYLVLTALLALNVSKEVLISFFEVNKWIERTTSNFDSKNGDTYAEFDNAVANNPEKYQEVRDKAFSIKKKADALVDSLQRMKYSLVLAVDGMVYLGAKEEFTDTDGDLEEEKAMKVPWLELVNNDKDKLIGYLRNKSERSKSGALFYDKKKADLGTEQLATSRKEEMSEYRDFLISLLNGNTGLIKSISETFNFEKVKQNDGKPLDWEHHNFVDMPAVSALTLLSKMQSDIRNAEANVIDYLKKDIDAKSLKFGDAEGVAIPKTNFVIQGDSFKSTIFIAAKQEGQEPEIWVGDVDTLADGTYEMSGDYDPVRVVNGKGIFATRTSSEGLKKWGGLIRMKTEQGLKEYPFGGEYLVASKQAVASPTNMNVLFIKAPNPIKVAVAGYSASQVSATIKKGYGTVKPLNKTKGEWIVEPSRLTPTNGIPLIDLYVNDNGQRKFMGSVEFKVKNVPNPIPKAGRLNKSVVSRSELVQAQMLQAELKDFYFDKRVLRYKVLSFKMTSTNKSGQFPIENKGSRFTTKSIKAIKNALVGTQVTFTDIKVQRTGMKPEILDVPCIYTIK